MNVHVVHTPAEGGGCASCELLLIADQTVVGKSQFSIFEGWPDAIGDGVKPPPWPEQKGLLWTGLYLRKLTPLGVHGWTEEAGALLCAVMEYALLEGCAFLAFAGAAEVLEYSASAGWRVHLHGRPRQVDGRTLVSASIEVSERALKNVRRVSRQHQVFLPFWQGQSTVPIVQSSSG